MARIAGVDLPRGKRIEVALTYIFGIGPTRASEIVREADPETGDVRVVLEERAPTFFESGGNWRFLPKTNELIWFSQRDNWGHLYLYDMACGQGGTAAVTWPEDRTATAELHSSHFDGTNWSAESLALTPAGLPSYVPDAEFVDASTVLCPVP